MILSQRTTLGVSWRDKLANEEIRGRLLDNKPLTTFSQNEDFAGLDMYYGWITSVHHNKRYTEKFLQVQQRTRLTLTKNKLERRNQEMWRSWNSPGKKLGQQLSTDQNGVRVWPTASTWMRDESRFKVQDVIALRQTE